MEEINIWITVRGTLETFYCEENMLNHGVKLRAVFKHAYMNNTASVLFILQSEKEHYKYGNEFTLRHA